VTEIYRILTGNSGSGKSNVLFISGVALTTDEYWTSEEASWANQTHRRQ